MGQETRLALESEAEFGDRAKAAWKEFIEPFVTRKHDEIFEQFQSLSSEEKDGMQILNIYSKLLLSLEDEMHSFIRSGQLAKINLEKDNG